MRFSTFLFVIVLLLSTLPACELIDAHEDDVSGRSVGSSIFITNRTEARVYYFVVGRETAALIDWAPHLSLETSAARGATVLVRPEDMFRADDEKEVIVYWWHAVAQDEQERPGEIHSFVVRL